MKEVHPDHNFCLSISIMSVDFEHCKTDIILKLDMQFIDLLSV